MSANENLVSLLLKQLLQGRGQGECLARAIGSNDEDWSQVESE